MATEGGTGGQKIERLEKGNKTRTARHSSVMNEIIDRLNSVLSGKVIIRSLQSAGEPIGKFVFSDANMLLDLQTGSGIPDPPDEDTWVLGAIDGEIQWIETSDCGDTGLNID